MYCVQGRVDIVLRVLFQAKNALSGLARVAAGYDSDGLDIHFLNHSKAGLGLKASYYIHSESSMY